MAKVTSRDVAREAGVSQNTVSLVARKSPLVRPETRARVLAAMERLGYHPNAMAAALRSRTSRALAFVMAATAIHDHVTAALLTGAIEEANRHGFSIVVQPALEPEAQAAVDLYRAQLVAGALVFARRAEDPLVSGLAATGCPTISLLQPHSALPPSRSVVADDLGGSEAAVRHLLHRDHRRLGLVAVRSVGGTLAAERLAGARAVAGAAGVPLDEVVADGWSVEAGEAAAHVLLGRVPRPTGVFALSDRLAFGVMAAAAAAGLRVPEDLAVAGFDNVEWSRYTRPPLTTVEFPLRDMGAAGVQRLLAPDAPVVWDRFPARLVVRGSS